MKRLAAAGVTYLPDGPRHQCSLMKPGQYQSELARIPGNVANGEKAFCRGLELLGVDRNEAFLLVDPPIGHGCRCQGQAEHRQQACARDLDPSHRTCDRDGRDLSVGRLDRVDLADHDVQFTAVAQCINLLQLCVR